MISASSLIDWQSIIYVMRHYIFLEPSYTKHGANTMERPEGKHPSFDRIIVGGWEDSRTYNRTEEVEALSLKVVLKEVSSTQRSEKQFCITSPQRVSVGGENDFYT